MTRVILIGLVFFLFFSGCLNDPNIVLVHTGSGGGSDTNQVAVSATDVNASFLFNKLSAGTNISLAIQNPGANEKVQITATGSAAGDLNQVMVSSTDTNAGYLVSKLVKGSGINVVKQNSGSNESLRVDLNASLSDLNSSQSCPGGQALQSVGLSKVCVDVNSTAMDSNKVAISGADTTPDYLGVKLVSGAYTSTQILNAGGNEKLRINASTCDNNSACTITGVVVGYVTSGVFNASWPVSDSNISSASKWNSDINWSQVNAIMPLGDVNILNASKWNADVNWQQIGAIMPLGDVNIANASLYKATCDNNASCTITGTITTVQLATFKNIQFNGTLSGGDFNYSLGDANGSQTASAGQALNSVGAIVSSIPIPPSLGTCDNNSSCTITGKILSPFDANISTGTLFNIPGGNVFAIAHNDFNNSTGYALAQSASGHVHFNAPVGQVIEFHNGGTSKGLLIISDTNVDTNENSIFENNIKFKGTISGGDFNYSLSDSNDSQNCPGGQALNSVGGTTSCVTISSGVDSNKVAVSGTDTNSAFLGQKIVSGLFTSITLLNAGANEILRVNSGTCDSNSNCVFTGKITTSQDINAKNVTFTGTLSGGDFNYSLGDANGSQSCGAGQALMSVGATLTCVNLNISDLNWNALNPIIPWQDVNVANDITLISSKDANVVNLWAFNPVGGLKIGENALHCLWFFPNANLLLPCTDGMNVGFPGVLRFGQVTTIGSYVNEKLTLPAISLGTDQFAFATNGSPTSGLQFNNTGGTIDAKNINIPYFRLDIVTDPGKISFTPLNHQPTFSVDKNQYGSSLYYRAFPDGNFLLYQHTGTDTNFVGYRQSFYDANFYFQGGDFNGIVKFNHDVGITDKNDNNTHLRLWNNSMDDENKLTGFDFNYTDANITFTNNQSNGDWNFQYINSGARKTWMEWRGSTNLLFLPQLAGSVVAANALQYVSVSGNIYPLISDENAKIDIVDINEVFDTNLCYSLEPRAYKDKVSGIETFGLVAQEVFAIAPELAILKDPFSPYDPVTNPPQGVNYQQLMAFCLFPFQKMNQKQGITESDLNAEKLLNSTQQDIIQSQQFKIDNLNLIIQNQQLLIDTQKNQIQLLIQKVCPTGGPPDPLCQQLTNGTIPV